MSRRNLDFVFAGGGAVLAVMLLVFGILLAGQASFAKTYLADQLGEQKIVFTQADKLTDAEKNWKPGSACLTEYAGQTLATGKQAECYANFYIAVHMDTSRNTAGFPGATYATLGGIRTQLHRRRQDEERHADGRRSPEEARLRHCAPGLAADRRDPPWSAAHVLRVQRLRREGR